MARAVATLPLSGLHYCTMQLYLDGAASGLCTSLGAPWPAAAGAGNYVVLWAPCVVAALMKT